jgi:uncharacterized membrane protein
MVLVLGLVLFLGIHLVPAVPPLRTAVIGGLGEARYKGLFSLASAAGLVLIVLGYLWSGPREPLFAPVAAAKAIAPAAMVVSFILFAAANMRGHLRRLLVHPMLLGLLIWSGVHFLANGDRTGSILFGAFFVYGAIDLGSAIARGARKAFAPQAKFDAMAVVGGIVVTVVVMALHRVLFGVPVASFGF